MLSELFSLPGGLDEEHSLGFERFLPSMQRWRIRTAVVLQFCGPKRVNWMENLGPRFIRAGNSPQPRFHINQDDRKAKVIETETWFIDSFEAWRRKRRLEKILQNLIHAF